MSLSEGLDIWLDVDAIPVLLTCIRYIGGICPAVYYAFDFCLGSELMSPLRFAVRSSCRRMLWCLMQPSTPL